MKILCIEDNEAKISLMRRLVTLNNHTLISYRYGERALENLAIDQSNLIVLDYMLAGNVTGLDLVKVLRFHGHGLPNVMSSAYTDKKSESLQAGCDVFLEKPIDVLSFIDILDRYASQSNRDSLPCLSV